MYRRNFPHPSPISDLLWYRFRAMARTEGGDWGRSLCRSLGSSKRGLAARRKRPRRARRREAVETRSVPCSGVLLFSTKGATQRETVRFGITLSASKGWGRGLHISIRHARFFPYPCEQKFARIGEEMVLFEAALVSSARTFVPKRKRPSGARRAVLRSRCPELLLQEFMCSQPKWVTKNHPLQADFFYSSSKDGGGPAVFLAGRTCSSPIFANGIREDRGRTGQKALVFSGEQMFSRGGRGRAGLGAETDEMSKPHFRERSHSHPNGRRSPSDSDSSVLVLRQKGDADWTCSIQMPEIPHQTGGEGGCCSCRGQPFFPNLSPLCTGGEGSGKKRRSQLLEATLRFEEKEAELGSAGRGSRELQCSAKVSAHLDQTG